MDTKTEYLQLIKPGDESVADIAQINDNMDVIDAAVSELRDKVKGLDELLHVEVGTWTLTPLVEGVSAALTVTLADSFGADGWHLMADGKDISGKIGIADSFTTAPIIFRESGLALVFEKNGETVFSAELEAGADGGGIHAFWDKAVSGMIAAIDITQFMQAAGYDADGDGVVDNAAKLGGQLPAYYAKDSEVVKKSVGLPNALTLKLNGSTSTYKGTSAVSKTWFAPTTAGTAGQVLRSSGSGAPVWGSVNAAATLTIAASDASDAVKASADYVCDGTADDVEINAAIQALPASGGEIVLTAGTYNITAPIFLNAGNLTIRGCGNKTVLKRSSDFIEDKAVLEGKYNGSNITIQSLTIDGNIANLTDDLGIKSYMSGIRLGYGNNVEIINVSCINNYSNGIDCSSKKAKIINSVASSNRLNGIYSHNDADSYVIIFGNSCYDNQRHGVDAYTVEGGNVIVESNTCHNNYYGISGENACVKGNICEGNHDGIAIYDNCTAIGNICLSNSYWGICVLGNNCAISGNACNNNANIGICVSGDNVSVNGNTCNDNEKGIELTYCKNVTVAGNTCIRGSGLTSDYSSTQYTIYVGLDCANSLIADNNIMGKNYAIYFVAGNNDTNTFVNNKYQ